MAQIYFHCSGTEGVCWIDAEARSMTWSKPVELKNSCDRLRAGMTVRHRSHSNTIRQLGMGEQSTTDGNYEKVG